MDSDRRELTESLGANFKRFGEVDNTGLNRIAISYDPHRDFADLNGDGFVDGTDGAVFLETCAWSALRSVFHGRRCVSS